MVTKTTRNNSNDRQVLKAAADRSCPGKLVALHEGGYSEMYGEWMGGWMDGWLAGWLAGWLDGWIDGWMDAWMDG